MAHRFNKPGVFDNERSNQPPSADGYLVEALAEWIAARKSHLPSPCPQDTMACVTWWKKEMQEPLVPGENHLIQIGNNGGMRWDLGYMTRIRTTLVKFLDETEGNRKFIVAARGDGVFWRGEPLDHFQDVYRDTLRMREIGIADYRNIVLENAKRKLGVRIPCDMSEATR